MIVQRQYNELYHEIVENIEKFFQDLFSNKQNLNKDISYGNSKYLYHKKTGNRPN